MKDKKGGELICKRPETIVEARFALTKKQNDIIDMVFATIKPDDNLEYEISLEKYAKLYNLKHKSNVYVDLKKASKSFEGKGFRILNKEKKREDYFPWFSRITYLDGESKIIVELGKTLKQLFLDVKRACFYNIEYTLNFKSIYGQRLYYYLKSFQDTGFRVDNLDKLKEKLECPPSYKNYSDFKRFVMNPAYEDINGNSDMNFEYEPIKTGRKVTNLKFYIKTNKTNTQPSDEVCATKVEKLTTEEENHIMVYTKTVQAIFREKITEKDAKALLIYARGNVNLIKEKYDLPRKSDIGNVVGWVRDAIKGDYTATKGKANDVGAFNDYEQRKYDFVKLEDKLLGKAKDNKITEEDSMSWEEQLLEYKESKTSEPPTAV